MQLSEKGRIISAIFIAFLKSAWNSLYLEKKYQLHSLNISEVIDSEKCFFLNVKKQLFQNNLRESKCSRVPNTAEILLVTLLC